MKKVLFVSEGQWGTAEPQEYRDLIDIYVCCLSAAKREFSSCSGKKGDKEAVVQVMATSAEAEEKIREERINVVIFISRSMGDVAKKLAEIFPSTKIIVLTGLIPEGEVIWVNKAWISDPQFLTKIVLS